MTKEEFSENLHELKGPYLTAKKTGELPEKWEIIKKSWNTLYGYLYKNGAGYYYSPDFLDKTTGVEVVAELQDFVLRDILFFIDTLNHVQQHVDIYNQIRRNINGADLSEIESGRSETDHRNDAHNDLVQSSQPEQHQP